MGLTFAIIIIIICVGVEAFFSGSEIAHVVADKLRLKARAESGDAGAVASMWFIKHPSQFFSTVIFGTNIAVVSASTVATFFLIDNYGESAQTWALLLSPIVLIFGEVLPKSLFQHYSNRIVERVSPPLLAIRYAIFPFVWILSKFTNFLLGGVRHHLGSEPRITREELALLISSSELPDVRPHEKRMITKVLELADQRVENVMVPMAYVESLAITATREDALEIFDLKGFSKLLIFERRSYNIVGALDCLDCLFSEGKDFSNLLKPVIYVPKGMRLHQLYLMMKDKKGHIAVAVDEYGAAVGMVTLEDILEEVIGDIKDEYELGKQLWRKVSDGHFLVSGRLEIEEANEKLGLEIPKGGFETVAGYLLHEFGYIPKVGEAVQIGKRRYIIKGATEKAILEIECLST